MAANKFATMLHRNAHKITVILVYAVLEWILILLLLLNSFFTYLITKFANYFGLKRPCLWCSRVDHVMEPGQNPSAYRELVCDSHATEISRLSYCTNHRKLAESQSMCGDCLASRPNQDDKSIGVTRRIAFISWVSTGEFGNGDRGSECCSCCNESLSSKLYPPYLLLKSSWADLDCKTKGGLILQAIDHDDNGDEYEKPSKIDCLAHHEEENEIQRNNADEQQSNEGAAAENQILSNVESVDKEEAARDGEADTVCLSEIHQFSDTTTAEHFSVREDDSLQFINLSPMEYVACDPDRLIPIELIDLSMTITQGWSNLTCLEEDNLREQDHENGDTDAASEMETQPDSLGEGALVVTDHNAKNSELESFLVDMSENNENAENAELEGFEMATCETENVLVPEAEERKQDLDDEACEQVNISEEAPALFTDDNGIEPAAVKQPDESPDLSVYSPEVAHEEETDGSKTLINSEGSDREANMPQAQEPVPLLGCLQDRCSIVDNGAQNDMGMNQTDETSQEETMALNEKNQAGANHCSSMPSEPHEAEEDKFPDTPTSNESLHYLQRKLLLFEKRESGTEESLDGSVISEMESCDPVLTIERLKAALKAERKSLSALYTELEEERSASAIAANQTMAMITRLQEEKAAMQMEALQYQRMMEEQSEYDQEALQLMNELMVRREKEKQELEKELVIYRNKVLDYEGKEKMRMLRRSRDGSVRSRNSSASSTNLENSDELSIDLNPEVRDEDSNDFDHQDISSNNTPTDEVLNLQDMALDCVKHISALDESLTEFEEERLSILDQLKALEEKLLALGDDEFTKDLNAVRQSSNYNVSGLDENHDFSSQDENSASDGFSKDKIYPERKTMASMAKSLLPLLDATDNETEEGDIFYGEQVESESVERLNSLVSKFEMDKKLAIVEEVDHVYERLQALEADREFLKHCMSSVKKGDKGMDLLQEILQHLRDLRAVELRVCNMSTVDPLG